MHERHGLTLGPDGKRTKLYYAWSAMRVRCNNPNTAYYKWYGGRGITVCPEWNNYAQFVVDVGPHPGDGWTFDRIDTNGNYEPGNWRWATRETQVRNRNFSVINLEEANEIRKLYAAGRYTQQELSDIYGFSGGHDSVGKIVRGERWK